MQNKFYVTDEEYAILDKKFGNLCCYAGWELIRRNQNNNCNVETEVEDVIQEIKMHIIKAGVYYKRQTYIENCLKVVKVFCKDKFVAYVVNELAYLWDNRKRHGANKKKFGEFQEDILELIIKKYVPEKNRPSVDAPLNIDSKFITYCKSIAWNSQKAIGKKISKERIIRAGIVSMSDKDFVI